MNRGSSKCPHADCQNSLIFVAKNSIFVKSKRDWGIGEMGVRNLKTLKTLAEEIGSFKMYFLKEFVFGVLP